VVNHPAAALRDQQPAVPVLRLPRPRRRPQVTRLARTIEAWWPQILAFIDIGITNATTEATNRMIKDAARIAFGFRNLENQRRRVLHCKKTTISQPVRR
jgi:transposase